MAGITDLSPRQRMINMLYLILLALLALNVSKEILKAFHLMEVSFVNANNNLDIKNDNTMAIFQSQMESNQARTKPWFDKAKQTRKIAKDFCDYIEEVKTTIVENADGRLENDENSMVVGELKTPSNMEKHANYFGGSSSKEGKGPELQDAINKAREDLIAILNDPKIDKSIPQNLEKNTALRADDPTEQGVSGKTWVDMYLVHSPLAGVVALLSKIQSDAKNLEADILNHLVKQIDAATIKIDAVEAKIIPKSSYIMSGSEYEAEIVLMALNTTAEPGIYVGGEKVPVEGGKGIYKVQAQGVGNHEVNGYIEYEGPDGVEKKEFSTEWQSFLPAATISADAMNMLYIGLDNPISVSVPGFRTEDVVVSAGAGCSLKPKGPGTYIAKVSKVGRTSISASVRMPDGTVRQMGAVEYRIRPVPNLEPKYGTLGSGKQTAGAVAAQGTLFASLGSSFAFEGLKYSVTKYTYIFLQKKSGNIRSSTVAGSSLATVNNIVRGAKTGDKLIIQDIQAKGPDGVKNLTIPLIIDFK